MRKRQRLNLGYGGTYLHAGTNLSQFLHALGMSSGSHRMVSEAASKLLGRKIWTYRPMSGDEFRALLNEIKTKRGA